MGYRSQVVLAISKELIPFLLLAISKNKEAEELVFKYGNLDRKYENDKSWLLVWDSIKWYEGYPDIDAIEKFIDQQIPQHKLEDFNYFHEPIIRTSTAEKPRRRKRNSATSRFGRRR